MAGLIGLRAEDMDLVDALRRARPDFPHGVPMVRPHVLAPVLIPGKDGPECVPARFGFSRRFSSFNARIEKLQTSPLWRGLFRTSHAVAPLSYVVEWRLEGARKQPYLIRRRGAGLLLAPALVGAYHEDRKERAFAICTREPNQFFAAFHDRMIGVLGPDAVARWLEPRRSPAAELLSCIAAPGDEELEAVPTDPRITARQAGDWSPLPETGPPLRWRDGRVE